MGGKENQFSTLHYLKDLMLLYHDSPHLFWQYHHAHLHLMRSAGGI